MESVLRATFVSMRPKHWIKNLLVFALPMSDGLIVGSKYDLDVTLRGIFVFLAICAASSANYILNDILDLEQDRQHATKRHRPFAAGKVPIFFGIIVAIVLLLVSVCFSLVVGGYTWALVLLFGALQFSYTIFFKHLIGYDLVLLSLLYVFRAVIPASYEQIDLSKWFLVIFFAGALFLATSKRYAEIRYSDTKSARRVLSEYTEVHLALWMGVSLALLIISYLSWIFTFTGEPSFLGLLASLIPISLILIRVSLLTMSESGEDPTKVIFQQKDIFILVAIWIALYLKGKGYL
jgi:decaprenyl-phosphate phosphoribosyltransferase